MIINATVCLAIKIRRITKTGSKIYMWNEDIYIYIPAEEETKREYTKHLK